MDTPRTTSDHSESLGVAQQRKPRRAGALSGSGNLHFGSRFWARTASLSSNGRCRCLARLSPIQNWVLHSSKHTLQLASSSTECRFFEISKSNLTWCCSWESLSSSATRLASLNLSKETFSEFWFDIPKYDKVRPSIWGKREVNHDLHAASIWPSLDILRLGRSSREAPSFWRIDEATAKTLPRITSYTPRRPASRQIRMEEGIEILPAAVEL